MYQREQNKQSSEGKSGMDLAGYSDAPLLGLNLNPEENEGSELDSLFQNASIGNKPIDNDTNLSSEDFAKRLDEFAKERQANPFGDYKKMVDDTQGFRETLSKN